MIQPAGAAFLHATTRTADEVVVVSWVAGSVGRFGVPAELVNQSGIGQSVQGPVDGGQSGGVTGGSHRCPQILRRNGSVMPIEQGEHPHRTAAESMMRRRFLPFT